LGQPSMTCFPVGFRKPYWGGFWCSTFLFTSFGGGGFWGGGGWKTNVFLIPLTPMLGRKNVFDQLWLVWGGPSVCHSMIFNQPGGHPPVPTNPIFGFPLFPAFFFFLSSGFCSACSRPTFALCSGGKTNPGAGADLVQVKPLKTPPTEPFCRNPPWWNVDTFFEWEKPQQKIPG